MSEPKPSWEKIKHEPCPCCQRREESVKARNLRTNADPFFEFVYLDGKLRATPAAECAAVKIGLSPAEDFEKLRDSLLEIRSIMDTKSGFKGDYIVTKTEILEIQKRFPQPKPDYVV